MLSEREQEIMKLIAQGKQDKEIAVMLDISQRTVSTHVARIFAKMRVKNRANAVFKYGNMSKRKRR